MGGAVSSGRDNDDLADKLADGNYIKSVLVERLFRAVDRAHYFLPDHAEQAYRDSAWRAGNIHLSAPCIYSEVLEALELRCGLSFLNLGSGTGYLSTMVGLALGPYSINHGIELHADVVSYAKSRLVGFVQNSKAFDEFDDLCQPIFAVGNCLLCSARQRYDRIYCGAACPENFLGQVKGFLKPGGILVVPVADRLLQCKLSEDGTTWSQRICMPVSFAGLVLPQLTKGKDSSSEEAESDTDNFDPPHFGINSSVPSSVRDQIPVLPDIVPPTLQQACRFVIRRHIRKLITDGHPELLKKRLFDREAAKKKQEESSENGEPPEHHRPRRRTRYLSIGNNFGVVIISENGSSDEESADASDSDQDEAGSEESTNRPPEASESTEQPTHESASSGAEALPSGQQEVQNAGEVEQPANRNRSQIPQLLRLLLEARRATTARQVVPSGENSGASAEPVESTEQEVSEGETGANRSRRRRRGSSTASNSASNDVKKQKEGGSGNETTASSPESGPQESTGRRISRLMHDYVHQLQLPTSIESFLVYYRVPPSALLECSSEGNAPVP